MRIVCTVAGIMCCLTAVGVAAEGTVKPLAQAHAHNDYEHERPLFDALARGFCSVEADVWLVGDELLVGHDRKDLKAGRTLESLYLKPLAERVRANNGRVYVDGPAFYLLIDVKSEAEGTYAKLHPVLEKYGEILTSYSEGQRHARAVTAILSGNRAFESVAKQAVRYVAIDGRQENLEANPRADLYPWISANWSLMFKAEPDGSLGQAERERLRAFVSRAHEQGRQVRFWATPEKEPLWRELRGARVDFINTDKLDELQRFLDSQSP
jgi:hypothetical protein